MQKRVALYAGSFDPPTYGHEHVIREGAQMFDELVVAVAVNPDKEPMLSPKEREMVLRRMTEGLDNIRVTTITLDQLTVEWANGFKAGYLLRGMRVGHDFEFERGLSRVNRLLEPNVQTVLIIPPAELGEVSSSLVKQIMATKNWVGHVTKFVPETVWAYLVDKHHFSAGFPEWCAMWRRLGSRAGSMALFDEWSRLRSAYGGNGFDRSYHSLRHVFDLQDLLKPYWDKMDEPDVVRLAIWFHDCVYEAGRDDNEQRSGQELTRACAKLLPTATGQGNPHMWAAREMIMASVHDSTGKVCGSRDTELFLDADLAVLGLPKREFATYRSNIRRECSTFSDADFAVGTAAFCELMLAQEGPIYCTPEFREKYEEQARSNLMRLLEETEVIIRVHGRDS